MSKSKLLETDVLGTVIPLKSDAMCHSHTDLVLHVSHSELAKFLLLCLDKSCEECLRDTDRYRYICFGFLIIEESPYFPV